jgi:hypothetical protein
MPERAFVGRRRERPWVGSQFAADPDGIPLTFTSGSKFGKGLTFIPCGLAIGN